MDNNRENQDDIYKSNFNRFELTNKEMLKVIFSTKKQQKEQGITRASREYNLIFQHMKKLYDDTQKILSNEEESCIAQIDKLLNKLDELEKYYMSLKEYKSECVNSLSKIYHLPVDIVYQCITEGTLFVGKNDRDCFLKIAASNNEQLLLQAIDRDNTKHKKSDRNRKVKKNFSKEYLNIAKEFFTRSLVIELIYSIRIIKLRQAESEGYAQAKVELENKLNNLKNDYLESTKNKCSGLDDLQDQISQIKDDIAKILDEIEKEEINIADLNILYKENINVK